MADALTLVIAPAAGAAVAALLGARAARAAALATMLAVAAVAVVAATGVVGMHVPGSGAPSLDAGGDWFALDAANAAFVLLTVVVFPAVYAGSRYAAAPGDAISPALVLLLESAVLGTFLAQDLLVLFVLWEASLLPMILLIVVGNRPERRRAALAFFLYTMLGSIPFLAAAILLGVQCRAATGDWCFALATLQQLPLAPDTQTFVFAAIAFACAIKAPVFPFHGWLPAAYCTAPAPATALMAGVLSKLGAFGLLRLAIPLAPLAAERYAPLAIGLGALSLVYGALLALRQERPRELVAYASLSHMGYVVIGAFTLTAVGTQGALLQVTSHGLTVAGLFLLVGMLERRDDGGARAAVALAARAPRLATMLLLFVLAAIALPSTAGFAAEFLVLLGAFQRGLADWQAGSTWTLAAAALASTGVILGAVYMLRFARSTVFGPVPPAAAPVPDLRGAELAIPAALLVAILALGLWPAPLLRLAEPAAAGLATPTPAPSGTTARLSPTAASSGVPAHAD